MPVALTGSRLGLIQLWFNVPIESQEDRTSTGKSLKINSPPSSSHLRYLTLFSSPGLVDLDLTLHSKCNNYDNINQSTSTSLHGLLSSKAQSGIRYINLF